MWKASKTYSTFCDELGCTVTCDNWGKDGTVYWMEFKINNRTWEMSAPVAQDEWVVTKREELLRIYHPPIEKILIDLADVLFHKHMTTEDWAVR